MANLGVLAQGLSWVAVSCQRGLHSSESSPGLEHPLLRRWQVGSRKGTGQGGWAGLSMPLLLPSLCPAMHPVCSQFIPGFAGAASSEHVQGDARPQLSCLLSAGLLDPEARDACRNVPGTNLGG